MKPPWKCLEHHGHPNQDIFGKNIPLPSPCIVNLYESVVVLKTNPDLTKLS